MGYWKDTFFAGWSQGVKEGITFKNKIVLTLRIIRNSFLGLWLFHIKPIFERRKT